MRISIRNEQFSGFEDSMCKAILNDNSVTFTILMRCLELIKRASFFYIADYQAVRNHCHAGITIPGWYLDKGSLSCFHSNVLKNASRNGHIGFTLRGDHAQSTSHNDFHLPFERRPLYDIISIFKKNFNSLTFLFVSISLLNGYISKAKE